MKAMKRIILPALFLAGTTVFGQPGSLDLNLNGAGSQLIDFGGTADVSTKVLVQPDSKIIVTGASQTATTYDFSVARLHPDGSPDLSFSFDGKVSTAIAATSAVSFDALLQPDGKIVLAGYGTTPGNANTFFVRYTSDGQLDNTFGSGGIVSLTTGPAGYSTFAAALQPDGKIIGAGMYNNGSDNDMMAVRLNTDGSLDFSFSLDALSNVDNGGNQDIATDVLVRDDGTILLVGRTINLGGESRVLVAGLDADGYLDYNFGSNGIVEIDFGNLINQGTFIAMQGSKVLVGGFSDIGTPVVMTVARLNTDGTMDDSFGTLGEVTVPFYTGDEAEAQDVLVQPDGKIVLAGNALTGTDKNMALARLNYDGTLDATFDTDGKVQTDLGGYEVGFSTALQPDGKILLTGRAEGLATLDFAVLRYISGINIGIGEVDAYLGSTLIYPNPILNNNVVIEYELMEARSVSIELFDLTGKRIAILQPEENESAGEYQKTLNLPSLSKGNYLIRLNTENGAVSVKVVVGN